MRKVVIVVAPVKAHPSAEISNPLTPEEVAETAVACSRAGAAMVHLHVRDSTGILTAKTEEYSRTLDLIRRESNIIIQVSTGGQSHDGGVTPLSLEERCSGLSDPRSEVGALNMGSVNFDDVAYVNTLPEIRYWAQRMLEAKVVPELEIFEGGMINNVKILAEEGLLQPPFVFSFCPGFVGALPATADTLFFLRGMLPQGAIWGVNHHEMRDFSLLAGALAMGASFVRTGYEDGIHYAPGRIAKTNEVLVEKLVGVVRSLGYDIATADEARSMFGVR